MLRLTPDSFPYTASAFRPRDVCTTSTWPRRGGRYDRRWPSRGVRRPYHEHLRLQCVDDRGGVATRLVLIPARSSRPHGRPGRPHTWSRPQCSSSSSRIGRRRSRLPACRFSELRLRYRPRPSFDADNSTRSQRPVQGTFVASPHSRRGHPLERVGHGLLVSLRSWQHSTIWMRRGEQRSVNLNSPGSRSARRDRTAPGPVSRQGPADRSQNRKPKRPELSGSASFICRQISTPRCQRRRSGRRGQLDIGDPGLPTEAHWRVVVIKPRMAPKR